MLTTCSLSRFFLYVLMCLFLLVSVAEAKATESALTFSLRYSADVESLPLDGRLFVMISTNNDSEPRFQIVDGPNSQQIFGIDVNGWRADAAVVFSDTVFGYPLESLGKLPAGDYWVQGLLHKYETFHRADGHLVKLPMDRGEGQHWNRAPGNRYSTPRKITIDPSRPGNIEIVLDQVIPPIEPVADSKYIKHIRIKSKLLSEFWGRPMHLGAVVLLPEGFDAHPEARYPLIINHGHFPRTFGEFREEPPDPDLQPDYSERFGIHGYNRIVQEHAHQFYKEWTGPDFPRMVIIKIQHANPYYDDSYAVNSQNLGPYGDAITYELVPHVEKLFRCIGEPWSRFLYGGSTGGWEALAAQVFYPDEYNGCFAACPDPIDFRAYCLVNIYEHKNAYYMEGPFQRVARPGKRNYLGEVTATLVSMNYRELALGTRSRSGEQWDIWEAVYSPVGADGYPRRIWDKRSGEIDPEVAEYWRENFDIGHILARDWETLGPKLAGKMHIYCGDMDNYYLNNAVYLVEDFLKGTRNPFYDGEVAYGDRAEHCWNGDPHRPNGLSRLRYHQMYVDKIIARMEKSAPAGSDLRSWRY